VRVERVSRRPLGWLLAGLVLLTLVGGAAVMSLRQKGAEPAPGPAARDLKAMEEVAAFGRDFQGEVGIERLLAELAGRVKAGNAFIGATEPHVKPQVLATLWKNGASLHASEVSLAAFVHLLAESQGLKLSVIETRAPDRGVTSFAGKRLAVQLREKRVPFCPSSDGAATGSEPSTAAETALHPATLMAWACADRARSARLSGDTRAAAVALDEALALAPQDPLVLFERCRLGMSQRMPEFALPDCEKALARGKDVDGLIEVAGFYLEGALLFRALQSVNDAIALDGKAAPAWVRRAEVRIAQLASSPADQQAALLADVDAAVAEADKLDAQVAGLHLARAKRAFLQNDFVTGADEAEAELRRHPDNEGAYTLLGDLYLRSQLWPELDDLYTRYLARWPGRPQGLQLLAVAKMQRGQGAEAETLLKKLLEVDPRRQGTRTQLATLYLNGEREADALALLDAEAQAFPDDPAPRLLKAQVLVMKEKWPEAIPALEGFVESWPKSPEGLTLLYTAYRRTNAPDKASALMDRADLKLVKARTLVARRLLEDGQLDDGLALLAEAARKAPDDEEIAVTLAATYHALGNEAEADATKARALERTSNRELLLRRLDEAYEEVRHAGAPAEDAARP
jgi:tetratricopeptide (TPR) repeat protein